MIKHTTTLLNVKKDNMMNHNKLNMRHRLVVAAIAAGLSGATLSAHAEDDVRYDGLAGSTPASEVSHLVNPQTPETDPDVKQPFGAYAGTSQNGTGSNNTVDYKANDAVGKIAVEIDKDGLPADGQSAVEVTVKLSDLNAQNLDGVAYIKMCIRDRVMAWWMTFKSKRFRLQVHSQRPISLA